MQKKQPTYRDFASQIWGKVLGKESSEVLPKILWEQDMSKPLEVNISLVCVNRENIFKFFYEMVSRWLVPEAQLEIKMNFSSLFAQKEKIFAVSEVTIAFKTLEKVARAKHNLPFLEKEILLGVQSLYQARKILEMKGMNLDDKVAWIQSKIAQLVSRFPKHFDYDIFLQMQHFIVVSKPEYKAVRSPSEMLRIIYTLYRFRRQIQQKVLAFSSRRHLQIKLRKTLLHTPFGKKEVLSVFLGLNFLREHELFEERHLLSAISQQISGVRSIPNSYYSVETEEEDIHTFYLEVEKEEQSPFTAKEMGALQKELPKEIGNRIEQLVPPVFMPRNEEEVMRNILTLSNQLKYLRDIPQMMISFDEQTDAEICFTVILVRILHENSLTIREHLESSSLAQKLSIDRIKVVGLLRRKYPKEAAILRVRLLSEDFIREDFSLDLIKARLALVEELTSTIGEVRDYNGGMIAKQIENYTFLEQELGPKAQKYTLLLQNFFHSIFPASLSSTTDPKILKLLFEMLLSAIDNHEHVSLESKSADDRLFVLIKFHDISLKQKVYNHIERLKLPSNELLSVQVQVLDSFYLGFVYLNPTKEKQKFFLEAIPDVCLTFPQKTPY